MDKLDSDTLNSIPSEEHIEVRAPSREGWHPCEKSHRSSLPGFTQSICSRYYREVTGPDGNPFLSWHPRIRSPSGFPASLLSAFRPTEHSAWRSWNVTSIDFNHSQLLIGTQNLSMVGQNPQFTGLGKPAVRMILGTYPSEPVHFLLSSEPESGSEFLT